MIVHDTPMQIQPNPIAQMLATQPCLVLDGALATELERRGCDLHDPLWSAKVLIEQPEQIRAVHSDYFEAGADIAITASYQATFEGFAARGLSADTATELLRRSVQLACEARDAYWSNVAHQHSGRARPLVAASIGPYGAWLHDGSEYRGDYGLTIEQLIAFHRPRMAVLANAGADLLACETIPSLDEARALARLLREFPDTYAWISFSARNGSEISHGELLADCLAELDDHPQIVALGVNCTAPQHIAALVETASAVTTKPIVIYPNSGETYDAVHQCWLGTSSSAHLTTLAQQWYERGARLIGGCCRTTPDDIRTIAAWRNSLSH
jgi:homocysteine S-methyltransferase